MGTFKKNTSSIMYNLPISVLCIFDDERELSTLWGFCYINDAALLFSPSFPPSYFPVCVCVCVWACVCAYMLMCVCVVDYLYATPEQLCKKLQALCRRPDVVRRHHIQVAHSQPDTCRNTISVGRAIGRIGRFPKQIGRASCRERV